MAEISRKGARLYYESHGEGPCVVFAHGMGGHHVSWFLSTLSLLDLMTTGRISSVFAGT